MERVAAAFWHGCGAMQRETTVRPGVQASRRPGVRGQALSPWAARPLFPWPRTNPSWNGSLTQRRVQPHQHQMKPVEAAQQSAQASLGPEQRQRGEVSGEVVQDGCTEGRRPIGPLQRPKVVRLGCHKKPDAAVIPVCQPVLSDVLPGRLGKRPQSYALSKGRRVPSLGQ